MSIRVVIFDLGGVVLRTEDPAPRRELAARLGLTREQIYYHVFDSPSAHQATLGQITADEHWESIRLAMGLGVDEFLSVREAFWGGDRLDTGLVDYIRSLRPRYKTALLSNDLSTRRHTGNPVPALLIGSPHQRKEFSNSLTDLTGVAPAILRNLGAGL